MDHVPPHGQPGFEAELLEMAAGVGLGHLARRAVQSEPLPVAIAERDTFLEVGQQHQPAERGGQRRDEQAVETAGERPITVPDA